MALNWLGTHDRSGLFMNAQKSEYRGTFLLKRSGPDRLRGKVPMTRVLRAHAGSIRAFQTNFMPYKFRLDISTFALAPQLSNLYKNI